LTKVDRKGKGKSSNFPKEITDNNSINNENAKTKKKGAYGSLENFVFSFKD